MRRIKNSSTTRRNKVHSRLPCLRIRLFPILVKVRISRFIESHPMRTRGYNRLRKLFVRTIEGFNQVWRIYGIVVDRNHDSVRKLPKRMKILFVAFEPSLSPFDFHAPFPHIEQRLRQFLFNILRNIVFIQIKDYLVRRQRLQQHAPNGIVGHMKSRRKRRERNNYFLFARHRVQMKSGFPPKQETFKSPSLLLG